MNLATLHKKKRDSPRCKNLWTFSLFCTFRFIRYYCSNFFVLFVLHRPWVLHTSYTEDEPKKWQWKDKRFFKQENNDLNSKVYDCCSAIPGFFKVRWNENLNCCSWGYGPKGLLKMSKVAIGDIFWRRAVHWKCGRSSIFHRGSCTQTMLNSVFLRWVIKTAVSQTCKQHVVNCKTTLMSTS